MHQSTGAGAATVVSQLADCWTAETQRITLQQSNMAETSSIYRRFSHEILHVRCKPLAFWLGLGLFHGRLFVDFSSHILAMSWGELWYLNFFWRPHDLYALLESNIAT